MSLIGTHVAVAGGLVKSGLAEASEVGAEIIQLFGGNPRSWVQRAPDPAGDDAFRAACAARGLPVVVHAPHLINLGSPSDVVLNRSLTGLETTLQRAAAIGATAVVVHAGALVVKGRRQAVLAGLHDLLAPIVDRAEVRLLIEPTAGAGEAMASTVESTIELMVALNDERIGLCLDTCHLHAAGEDLAEPGKLVSRVTDALGPQSIGLIHVNDSRDPLGSHRDRHESLGSGTLDSSAFEALLKLPALQNVPMLVETPTHNRDVAILKTLRSKSADQESAQSA